MSVATIDPFHRNPNWRKLQGIDAVASPGLLVDQHYVDHNIATMLRFVDSDASRLRPHVKTHKMPEVIKHHLSAGITQFKAATLEELQMVAAAGASDVLLAYQPVGPNVDRLLELMQEHPEVRFSALTDHESVVDMLESRLQPAQRSLDLFIDVDCGMHRTGIELGAGLDRLRDRIAASKHLKYAGLHVYDGHLHSPSHQQRGEQANQIIESIRRYDAEHPSPAIIGGGSPTFAVWAEHTPWQCSPGTPVFWDIGYATDCSELPFHIALAVITRVISKPSAELICLDLGYKSIASEMPLEHRVFLPQIQDARLIGHSEEHLVVQTPQAHDIPIGQTFLAFPRHVCPTVARHSAATIVRDGKVTSERWTTVVR